MQLKHKKSQLGFTLIELIVSIAILLTLIGVFLANFEGRSGARNLTIAAANLSSDLHKLQSFSLSSKDITPGNPASQYSVVFANNAVSYSLTGYNNAMPAVPTVLSTINFPGRVFVNAIQITKADGTTAAPLNATVTFKIPYGRMVTNYPGSVTNENNDIVRVQLNTADTNECTYVFVNGVTGNVNSDKVCP